MRAKPFTIRLGSNRVSEFILKQMVQVSGCVVWIRFTFSVTDVVCAVVVHAVKVVASLDQGYFIGCQGWETVADLFHDAVGVFAKVDGVCKPGDGEFEFAGAGFNVFWVFGVPGFGPVTLNSY